MFNKNSERIDLDLAELLPEAAKQLPVIVKSVFLTAGLFSLPNILFIIYGIVYLIIPGNFESNLISLIILFIVSTLTCALAFYLTYKYVLVIIIKAVYKYLRPFFARLSAEIAAVGFDFKQKLSKSAAYEEAFKETVFTPAFKKLNKEFARKAVDKKSKMNVNLDVVMPAGDKEKAMWLIKKALGFFINRIPFKKFCSELSGGKDSSPGAGGGDFIYRKTDAFIKEKFFANNNLRWMLYLIPVYLSIQILVLSGIK